MLGRFFAGAALSGMGQRGVAHPFAVIPSFLPGSEPFALELNPFVFRNDPNDVAMPDDPATCFLRSKHRDELRRREQGIDAAEENVSPAAWDYEPDE